MALGTNDINEMKLQQGQVLNICKEELSSQLEVFKTSVQGIRDWANETTVGKNIEQDMITIIEGIDGLINITRIICGNIGDFCENQTEINRNVQS